MGLLEETVGRTLMVGLPGPEPDAATVSDLRALRPAGLILFPRNLVEPEQTIDLLRRLRSLLPESPWVALDQEGGRVSRLEPWIGVTPTASRLSLGATAEAAAFGRVTASAMRALGFNLDFAPVVDLCRPDAANGIGDRSFGADPRMVTRVAGEFLAGLQGGGVAGCLKHFPGLGHTTVDSHVAMPVVRRDLEQLERADLWPFRALRGLTAAVMVGHGHYPALDPNESLPASCSPRVVGGLLRGRLGFAGLVVSDDLEMGAVVARDEQGGAAVEALAAGCDLLLYCGEAARARVARQTLAAEARRSAGFRDRLERAARRVREAATRWPLPEAGIEHWHQARADFHRFSRLV